MIMIVAMVAGTTSGMIVMPMPRMIGIAHLAPVIVTLMTAAIMLGVFVHATTGARVAPAIVLRILVHTLIRLRVEYWFGGIVVVLGPGGRHGNQRSASQNGQRQNPYPANMSHVHVNISILRVRQGGHIPCRLTRYPHPAGCGDPDHPPGSAQAATGIFPVRR